MRFHPYRMVLLLALLTGLQHVHAAEAAPQKGMIQEENFNKAQPSDNAAPAPYEKRMAEMEREMAKLKAKTKVLEDELNSPGMRSILDEHFELGGEIELEWVDTQKESNQTVMPQNDEDTPYLRVDKVRLSPFVRLTKKKAPIVISVAGAIDYKGNSANSVRIKEMHATFEGRHTPSMESRFRIGLEDRFIAMNRETEYWPLAATAFWRNESLGFFWRTELWDNDDPSGRWAIYASLTNGYVLDTKAAGEDDAFELLSHDSRMGGSESALREYGFGLGWDKRWLSKDDARWIEAINSSVMIYYYNDSLGDDDDTFGVNNPVLGLNTSNLNGKELYGINAVVEVGPLETKCQLIHDRTGRMRRKAGYVEGSYGLEFEKPLIMDYYLSEIKPVVRYGWLKVSDVARNPQYPITWDRTRWTLGIVTEIRKHLLLKTEYTINDEKTGGSDPDTNELLVQLEIKF